MLELVLDRAARARRSFADERRFERFVADLIGRGLADPDSRVLRVHRPRWSPVGVAVALVGSPERGASLVVKLSHSRAGAASLAREAETLRALHGDERIGEVRAVIPRPVASLGDPPVAWVQTALPGRPPAGDPATNRDLAAALLEFARALRGATAARTSVGDALLDRWIDEPLETIARAVKRDRRTSVEVAPLRDRLRAGFGGRELVTSWIHGDLWLGNVLVPGSESAGASDAAPRAITGIVDWDRAGSDELPWHDVLHPLLGPEWLSGSGSADVIAAAATGRRRWTAAETVALDAVREELADDSPPTEALAALHWLRHVAATLTADPALGRSSGFVASNVLPLLALEPRVSSTVPVARRS